MGALTRRIPASFPRKRESVLAKSPLICGPWPRGGEHLAYPQPDPSPQGGGRWPALSLGPYGSRLAALAPHHEGGGDSSEERAAERPQVHHDGLGKAPHGVPPEGPHPEPVEGRGPAPTLVSSWPGLTRPSSTPRRLRRRKAWLDPRVKPGDDGVWGANLGPTALPNPASFPRKPGVIPAQAGIHLGHENRPLRHHHSPRIASA